MSEEQQERWHHLFGMSWKDFFFGTDVKVQDEIDLSHHRQLLDLLIVRPDGNVPLPERMPDGFEELAAHNLITFKSHREPLTSFALNELVGHYVNYRKQTRSRSNDLLPETDFLRFAVVARRPHNLFAQSEVRELQTGVYEARHFSDTLRIVVLNELPLEPHNAILILFSASRERFEYAAREFRQRSAETSTLLRNLIAQYREEGIPMPETIEEFNQRVRREVIHEAPIEERLEGIPPEDRLTGLTPEQLQRIEELARQRREAQQQSPPTVPTPANEK
jgi:hypothetical protein